MLLNLIPPTHFHCSSERAVPFLKFSLIGTTIAQHGMWERMGVTYMDFPKPSLYFSGEMWGTENP